MAVLPTNVQYGTVSGQFLFTTADGVFPAATPTAGRIQFIPFGGSTTYVPNVAGKVVHVGQTIETTFDREGFIVDPDNATVRQVTLIASDNPAMNPQNWPYRVVFDVPGVKIASFDILVLAGQHLDLSSYIPVPLAPVVGEAAAIASSKAYIDQQIAALRAQLGLGAPGGGGNPVVLVIDNGNGTSTVTAATLLDNGNGTTTLTDPSILSVVDNGNGTSTITTG